MRVLHVYKTYFPDTMGGIEQVLLQLTRGLKDLGVENRLLVLSPDASEAVIERPEATVYRYPITAQFASNPVSWQAMWHFREHLAWADVVHYQFPWPFADLLKLVHQRRKPSVVTYQSDIVRQKKLMTLYRPLMSRFLNSVDLVVVTSPDYLETSEVLSKLARRPQVIPNGLDECSCPRAPESLLAHWRQVLGEGFFLFVGVLRYYKGLETLVQAASLVDSVVVIAGTGPEEERLRALAAASSVNNLYFLGHISDADKAALLQLSRVFVFPSHLRSEAFGMSLIESSMYAKPMISCDIGSGMSYINQHEVTGLVVPPEAPQALANAMERFIQEPELGPVMGRAARQRYEQLFTGRRMAAAYLDAYQQILMQ
jgi:rhamnosyl/mannosyltransferase